MGIGDGFTGHPTSDPMRKDAVDGAFFFVFFFSTSVSCKPCHVLCEAIDPCSEYLCIYTYLCWHIYFCRHRAAEYLSFVLKIRH